jgi:hypothetical protein
MSNLITLNGNEISLIRIGINNNLNKKQQAILEMMHKCITDKTSFNWDAMVNLYSKLHPDTNVTKYNHSTRTYYNIKINIQEEYQANSDFWTHREKRKIRGWFATNIGSMVLKGSILALPIIELD